MAKFQVGNTFQEGMGAVLQALAQAEMAPDADHQLTAHLRQMVLSALHQGGGQAQPGAAGPGPSPQGPGAAPGGPPGMAPGGIPGGGPGGPGLSRPPTPGMDVTSATQDLQRMLSGG